MLFFSNLESFLLCGVKNLALDNKLYIFSSNVGTFPPYPFYYLIISLKASRGHDEKRFWLRWASHRKACHSGVKDTAEQSV